MDLNLHKGFGLGLTAKGKRSIVSGKQFETFFPKPVNTDPILKKDGSVKDTVSYCEEIVKKTLGDTKQLARYLKRPTLKATCKAVFDFFYQHYQYQLDKTGVEQLRRPARAWQDRGNSLSGGIDCDCFSISVSSVLSNLGISHSFRIVKMYGRGFYQHIYVVVPKVKGADMRIRCNYYVIDPVLDKFNLEAPGITKKTDKQMTMPIQYLNGVGEAYMPRLGREFDGLGSGLGCACGEGLYRDFMKRQKMHLINTRNHIAKHPHKVAKVYRPETLRGMYDTLIGAWDNDNMREATLEHLSGIEDEALQPEFRGLGSVIHADDEGLWSVVNGDLAGLGKAKAKSGGKKAGVFTKIKNATKKVAAATKKVAKNAGKVVKKVAKAVVKFNPVSTTARLGMLLAMKTNFGRLAERMYWGYFSEAEAKAKGVTSSYWKKAKSLLDKTEKVFTKTLMGDPKAFKQAVLNGRAAKKAPGVKGLGIVTATAITSALAFITPLLTAAKNLFSKGNGKEETETGGETTPPADDKTTDTTPAGKDASSDSGSTSDSSSSSASGSSAASGSSGSSSAADSSSSDASGGSNTSADSGSSAADSSGADASGGGDSGSSKGKVIGAIAGLGLLAGLGFMAMKGKKKNKTAPATSGIGSTHKKKKKKSHRKKSIATIKLS